MLTDADYSELYRIFTKYVDLADQGKFPPTTSEKSRADGHNLHGCPSDGERMVIGDQCSVIGKSKIKR